MESERFQCEIKSNRKERKLTEGLLSYSEGEESRVLLPHFCDARKSPDRHRVVHQNDVRRNGSRRPYSEGEDLRSARWKPWTRFLSQESLQGDDSRKGGSVLGARGEDSDRVETSKDVDEATLNSPSIDCKNGEQVGG